MKGTFQIDEILVMNFTFRDYNGLLWFSAELLFLVYCYPIVLCFAVRANSLTVQNLFSLSSLSQIIESRNGSVFDLSVSRFLQFYICSSIKSHEHFRFLLNLLIIKSATAKLKSTVIYEISMRRPVVIDFLE